MNKLSGRGYDLEFGVGQRPHQIPTSVVKSSRAEIDDLHLTVRAFTIAEHSQLTEISTFSTLPDDLAGYYLVAAALSPEGTQVINGDGMIYRLEFVNGQATLKARIAKPPCYYADQITQKSDQYPPAYHFQDAGPSRMSAQLGNRNQLNTAFLATRDRLLLTFDAGIPWVFDPNSMEVIEPVGRVDEWLSVTRPFAGFAPSLEEKVFLAHTNPAHPVCDRCQPEQDFPICSTTQSSPLPDYLLTLNYSTGYKGKFRKPVDRAVNWIRRKTGRVLGLGRGENTPCTDRFYGFADLIRYTFDDRTLERWQLVLPDWDEQNPDDAKLLIPEQSIHQMILTQDYIILADMAFKIEYSQLFSPLFVGRLEWLLEQVLKFLSRIGQQLQLKNAQSIETLPSHLLQLRLRIGYWLYSVFLQLLPASQITNFYIIRRSDLRDCGNNPGSRVTDVSKSIRVQKVTIPREISHFTADYSNPDGKIILHVGHQNGTDVTEWISKYDRSVPGKEQQFGKDLNPCRRLAGMTTGAMDVSSFGRYEIDGDTGALLDSKVFSDMQHTWWPSVYAHRELCRDRPDESATEVTNLFWMCWGFSWEIIPDRLFQVYKDREFRVIHHTHLPEANQPCKLLRLDSKTMKLVDWFDFPPGHFACSPQFIPKSTPCPPDQDPSTHGYLACVVLADAPNQKAETIEAEPYDEFWIFDANNLGNRQVAAGDLNSLQEPAIVYKLSATQALNLGLTIHSIWLSLADFEHRSQPYRDSQIRQKFRQAAFWRDYGTFLKTANSEPLFADQPRLFQAIDPNTKNLCLEIQEAFIQQQNVEFLE